MDIRVKKNFPYPLLALFNDDYLSSSFAVTEPVVRTLGKDTEIIFNLELNSRSLNKLIREGKAAFVHHVECPQTSFRRAYQTNEGHYRIELPAKEIRGKVEITSFVAAIQDITGYTSDEFNEDYQGMEFDLEAGCILAMGETSIANVGNRGDDLKNIPSIFSIKLNPLINARELEVDYNSRKILIKLPEKSFFAYKSLNNLPQFRGLLNSMTVLPALIYILEVIQQAAPEERSEFEDQTWYQVISKTLMKDFSIDVEDPAFKEKHPVILAQKMIGSPFNEAFQVLTNSFDHGGED